MAKGREGLLCETIKESGSFSLKEELLKWNMTEISKIIFHCLYKN